MEWWINNRDPEIRKQSRLTEIASDVLTCPATTQLPGHEDDDDDEYILMMTHAFYWANICWSVDSFHKFCVFETVFVKVFNSENCLVWTSTDLYVYILMLRFFGYDMCNPINVFPKNLI